MRRNTIKFLALLLVAILPLALSACGGGGGGSSSSSSSSSSSGTTSSSSSSGTTSSSSSSSGTTSSSSSSSGAVVAATTPLTVATQVSVVDPHLSGSVAAAKPLAVAWYNVRSWFRSAPSGTSDYNMDKTQVYVQERSTESFDTINMILCMMGQTKYDAMLNQGNYLALVDNNVCSSNKSSTSSAGQQSQNQSSSANVPDYYQFTTVSSRVSNTADEIVKIWIHQPASGGGGGGGGDPEELIYVNIVISEGTSSINPYGIFTLNYAGYPIINGTQSSLSAMHGTLRAVRQAPSDPSSKVLLQFVSNDKHGDGNGGIGTSSERVTLDRQPDGSGGAGHVFQNYLSSNGSGTTNFDIAFNASDFYRKDLMTSGEFCMSRIAFDESAWSYSLYDTTGARVSRNSGFPISFTKGGVQHQGFVGYWGLWTDNTATLSNGDTVNKMDYNGGNTTTTPYTVFIAGGKLHKHVKQTLTLGNIKNVPIQYNEWSGSTGTNYQVVWDGSNLNKVAYMPQMCNGNCTWANMTPVAIDVTHLTNGGGSINFWSDSLGGSGQIVLSNCTFTAPPYIPNQPPQPGYTSCAAPTSSNTVIFYTDSVVYPGDTTVPGSFSCYDNCPTVDPTSGQATMPSMMSGPSMTPTATNYTFSATTGANGMTLMLGTDPVLMTMLTSTQQWGIQSGPMFDPSSTDMSLFDCNWDGDNNHLTNPQICSWKAWNVLPVFYTWETGPDNWNQFIGVKDSNGTFVKFDTPLMVKYVGLGDPYGTLGATFMLQYGGFGQLQGIPGKCVNMDTGADADCSTSGGSNSIRWVPQFTIPTLTGGNPTTVVDASDNTTQYYVKPLQVEQRMKADTTAGACSFAPTDFSEYTLPDFSIWTDPVVANGTEPNVTEAPAVIGGVVQ